MRWIDARLEHNLAPLGQRGNVAGGAFEHRHLAVHTAELFVSAGQSALDFELWMRHDRLTSLHVARDVVEAASETAD